MNTKKWIIWSISLTALVLWVGAADVAKAQEKRFFVEGADGEHQELSHTAITCRGRVGIVIDAADEALHATPAVFGAGAGGGEGGQFDPTPVLTVPAVSLEQGECLNAHLSILVGSAQSYGGAPLALIQVTLTPAAGGPPIHMVGHFPTPYGIASPAVALEAESDVDMFAANFFQAVGPDSEHGVPPGVYRVDVWWAGAPPGAPGGTLGAAFVLKLYLRD